MRARNVGAGLAIIAIAAGALVGARKLVTDRAAHRTAQTWADARACLLGPPLDAGETVRERVLRIRYARSESPPHGKPGARSRMAAPDPAWPTWCRDDVLTLAERRGGVPELPDLAKRLAQHLERMNDARATKQPGLELDMALLDALTTAASTLEPVFATSGHRLAEISPRPMIDGPMLAALHERYEGFSAVHFLGRDEQSFDQVDLRGISKNRCTVHGSDGKPLSSLACSARSLPPSERGFLAPDGALFHFVNAEAKPGPSPVKGVNGDAPPPMMSSLDRVQDGHAESLMTIEGSPFSAFIADRQVVWRNGQRWLTRSIRPAPPWLGEPLQLADEAGLDAVTCRAPSRTVLALLRSGASDAPRVGGETRGGFRLFSGAEGGFSPPVDTRWEGPSGRRERTSFGPRTLSCSDVDARFASARTTWDEAIADENEATRWICSNERCVEERVSLGRLEPVMTFTGGNWTSDPDGLWAPLVIDLGPRTLVVWRSHGAIWARLAPFAELGSTPDRIIAGDDETFEVSFAQDTVLTRDRTALLFLTVRRGGSEAVATVRADADGDLRVLGTPAPGH